MSSPIPKSRLPLSLWLVLPLCLVPVQILAKMIGEDFYRRTMRGELGLVENLTVLALVIAVGCAVVLFKRRKQVAYGRFGTFALIMAGGCFYFGGEEASWGEHWFGFTPPAAIAERNDQHEFNLHNDPLLEPVFDQLPRLLLTIAALAGGIIAPIVLRKRGVRHPRFDGPGYWGWIWPTYACMPAALMVVTVSMPKKIFRALGQEQPYYFDISPGETKELALALFLMIYLLTLVLELGAASAPDTVKK